MSSLGGAYRVSLSGSLSGVLNSMSIVGIHGLDLMKGALGNVKEQKDGSQGS